MEANLEIPILNSFEKVSKTKQNFPQKLLEKGIKLLNFIYDTVYFHFLPYMVILYKSYHDTQINEFDI